jgi:hypothetical protein
LGPSNHQSYQRAEWSRSALPVEVVGEVPSMDALRALLARTPSRLARQIFDCLEGCPITLILDETKLYQTGPALAADLPMRHGIEAVSSCGIKTELVGPFPFSCTHFTQQ